MDLNSPGTGASHGAERRRHRRFPCEGYAEVVCCHPTFLFRGRIRDISLMGCFIETAARLRLEKLTEVEVRFTASGRHITTPARLMAIRPGKGAGFEFLPGGVHLQQAFARLIESLKNSAEAPQPEQPAPAPKWASSGAGTLL